MSSASLFFISFAPQYSASVLSLLWNVRPCSVRYCMIVDEIDANRALQLVLN